MRRLMTAVLAAGGLALAACASPGAQNGGGEDAAAEKVTVGVIPIVIYLGKEKGFFSERGIDLQLESGQGGAASRSASSSACSTPSTRARRRALRRRAGRRLRAGAECPHAQT